MGHYVTLKIGETAKGQQKLLHALRSTADYYGWTEEFPVWIGKKVANTEGYVLLHDPGRRGNPQCSPGKRLRISRSPIKSRYAAGFTNAFKVSANTGLFDLAELAHFTKVDWNWMSTKTGERIKRAQWEDRYAGILH